MRNGRPALDFSDTGLGTNFASLAPERRQVFYIGDGLTGTGSGIRQHYTAPAGATRVLLGTMDAVYTDNSGAFSVDQVPEPALGLLELASVATLPGFRRLVRRPVLYHAVRRA